MKILVNGQEKEAIHVGVVSSGEPWGEALLDDGTLIRTRSLVMGAYRIVGETTALGLPVYQIESTTIINVVPPSGCGPA